MSADSVIHLVENLDANSDTSGQPVSQNVQTLCVANIETVTEVTLIFKIACLFTVAFLITHNLVLQILNLLIN